jgi:hypothetical protein
MEEGILIEGNIPQTQVKRVASLNTAKCRSRAIEEAPR